MKIEMLMVRRFMDSRSDPLNDNFVSAESLALEVYRDDYIKRYKEEMGIDVNAYSLEASIDFKKQRVSIYGYDSWKWVNRTEACMNVLLRNYDGEDWKRIMRFMLIVSDKRMDDSIKSSSYSCDDYVRTKLGLGGYNTESPVYWKIELFEEDPWA